MPNLAERGFVPEVDDKPHEECGFVGVVVPNEMAPIIARNALGALQHRGTDGAGITIANGRMETKKKSGLIENVLTPDVMSLVDHSNRAIAHTRYATNGGITGENIQPIQLSSPSGEFTLSLAHNGNLTNSDWFKDRVDVELPEDASDTVALTQYLLQRRHEYESWRETFRNELPSVEGAFSAVALTEDGDTHGFRDNRGIRPYAVGTFADGGTILASESVAIQAVGGQFERHLERGEIITVTSDGERSSQFYGEPKRERFCSFENFYFMRPQSFNNGIRVQDGRKESGRRLARRVKEKGIEIDGVVPVHASGEHAGAGFAEEYGAPIIEAIGTDRYNMGRTFILPDQGKREDAVRSKHIVLPDHLDDKALAEVDDSTVRGTTSRVINADLFDGGAREVHQAVASPPAVDRCDLGVDMEDRKELPAADVPGGDLQQIEDYMAKKVVATTMTYLPVDELSASFGRETKNMCTFCLGGEHPIHGPQEQFPQRERQINGKPKLAVFISGNGTNLQKIIDGTQSGLIDADISTVVSNNPEAFGLQRAAESDIPTAVVPSKGRLKDQEKRSQYEQELIDAITSDENNLPDALVLAGFMNVLGDNFLQRMQELEIPVLNLHPGLLTAKDGEKVATSRGLMPIFRGTDAIKQAFDRNVRSSGVTVHQLLPGNTFDTGPIILKQEVHRRVDDTPETWEAKIHAAEYQTLPTAINRVLHVMKHGIDVSKGDFPW